MTEEDVSEIVNDMLDEFVTVLRSAMRDNETIATSLTFGDAEQFIGNTSSRLASMARLRLKREIASPA